MKTRNCPCCNEAISFKVFLKALFAFKKRNFAENEAGVLCPYCKKSIVSAERKNRFFIPILGFALLPVLLGGFTWEVLLESTNSVYFASYFLLTIIASFIFLTKAYQNVTFICDDESSEKYNKEMTYA